MNHSLLYKLLIAAVLAGVFLAFANVSTSTAERVRTQQGTIIADAH